MKARVYNGKEWSMTEEQDVLRHEPKCAFEKLPDISRMFQSYLVPNSHGVVT